MENLHTSRHVVFIQHGDYREAAARFARGEPETYVAQRHSVEFVASLANHGLVTVVALRSGPYDEVLPSRVRAIGLAGPTATESLRITSALNRLSPTHLIVATPNLTALAWGILRRTQTLPLLADSFHSRRWYTRIRACALAHLLSSKAIRIVANHNMPAALELVRIGVPASKVVAWDWPPQHTPYQFDPKVTLSDPLRPSIVYVGKVSEPKGVGDLIRALPVLIQRSVIPKVSVWGNGDLDAMRTLAIQLGVSNHVEVLGPMPNTHVIEAMRAHDIVVVPSRPDYPEGLPMTIYEALCSRTPLLLSDHPMFERALGKSDGVRIFASGNPTALAEAIQDVAANAEMYARLSQGSAHAWDSIQVPLQRADLISAWLSGDDSDRERVLSGALGHSAL